MILCTPGCGTTGEHAYWRRLLHRMTVGRTEVPKSTNLRPWGHSENHARP